jgi:hypothetical protein
MTAIGRPFSVNSEPNFHLRLSHPKYRLQRYCLTTCTAAPRQVHVFEYLTSVNRSCCTFYPASNYVRSYGCQSHTNYILISRGMAKNDPQNRKVSAGSGRKGCYVSSRAQINSRTAATSSITYCYLQISDNPTCQHLQLACHYHYNQ